MTAVPLLDLLGQGEIWHQRNRDGELETVRVADMDERHLANLRAWLLRRAPDFHFAAMQDLHHFSGFISGEQALHDLGMAENELGEQPPADWMKEQKLYRALGRQISKLQRGRS